MAIKARPACEICSRRLESCMYLPVLHHFPLPVAQVELTDALNASVNSTCAQPPRATAGHFPTLSVPGVGYLQILHCPGAGHLPTRGHSRAFDTHAVSYQNITTQKVLLEKKQIGSSVKDRNKLKRVVKACSRFYACISSLLIKPELHSEIGAIDVNQRFLVIESNFCWYYLKNILSYL